MSRGWLALVLFIAAAAACGAPGSTDTGTTPTDTGSPSGTTNPTSPTPTPSGSHTVTPTPSGSPTPLPTITNVPSYAGWVANVKPLAATSNCLNCHHNIELTFMVSSTDTDPDTLKAAWFTHLCNYQNAEHQGVLTYPTPTGETVLYYCNQSNPANAAAPNHPGGTVPSNFCAAVTNWLKTGTGTAPYCGKAYDLTNSQ